MSLRDDSRSNDKSEPPFIPLDAVARVSHEDGRWVVYLNVQSWAPGDSEPGDSEIDSHANAPVDPDRPVDSVESWRNESGDAAHPIANNWKRISEYSSEAEARVAASWYERSANKSIRPPSGF